MRDLRVVCGAKAGHGVFFAVGGSLVLFAAISDSTGLSTEIEVFRRCTKIHRQVGFGLF